jgi:hypothetical protein
LERYKYLFSQVRQQTAKSIVGNQRVRQQYHRRDPGHQRLLRLRHRGPTTLAFYPITPCRIADTRNATGPLGGPSLGVGQSRTFPIRTACSLPATAQAYSLNLAAVPGGPLGYLTAWPTGQTMPLAASLNALTGTVTANADIVRAGTAGSIDVYASNATNLVIDINGYFAPMGTGGLSLFAPAAKVSKPCIRPVLR